MDALNAIPGLNPTGKGKKRGKATNGPAWHCPAWVIRLCIVGVVAFCFWGAFKLFVTYYYKRNAAFLVAPEQVHVLGNATVTRDYILQMFDITKPRNGFDLVQSDIVEMLSSHMPNLKSAQMTYTPSKKVELWVEERMPVARVKKDSILPLVVDEEGVLFRYPRPVNTLPEIGGFDLPDEELMPGKRLPVEFHCMLRLLLKVSDASAYFNSAVKRVTLLGIDPDDGLLILLHDGRKIAIAWENMASETAVSEAMVKRLENVRAALRSSASAGKLHFNAMASDRVSVSD
jgi:cell division septal protein FtsQ